MPECGIQMNVVVDMVVIRAADTPISEDESALRSDEDMPQGDGGGE